MFRKISATGKRPKAVRKRTIDDDDDDDDDDDNEQKGNPKGTTATGTLDAEGSVSAENSTTKIAMTTQQQIQYTKKKRKLLTNLQYKRGLDTNQLLQVKQTNHNHNNSDNADETDSADADVEPDPLTTPASSSAAEQGSQEGVLESKHKQAMESYIQQKMKLGAANAKEAVNWNTNNNNNNNNDDMGIDNNDSTEKEIRQHATTLTKEQLYRELAVAAARLAGKTDNNTDSSNIDSNKKINASDSTKDGDVGAGGAMLVAGTGIAEVILPVDERLKTHKDTNESVQARNQQRGKNKNAAAAAKSRNTSSTATGSNRPSAVPNRFFVPSTMASFPQSRDAAAAAAAAATSTSQQQSATSTGPPNAVDDDRLGFDAVKRQREGSGASLSTQQPGQRPNQQQGQQQSSSTQQQQRNSKSSDDRVFRKFVSRQRDAQMRDKK